MKIQVLVATMNQSDYSLIEKMNIRSCAIVGNQCDKNLIEDIKIDENEIKWLSFNERGVGLNRNNALMRADGDICLIADDDMVYYDNYCQIVSSAFERYPDADIIIFNLEEENPERYVIKKDMKVNRLNYLRYGTARIAFKLESIKNNGIYFNQCFGGGTKYCHGEDNLFLTACLNNNLKIYAVTDYIAKLTNDRESTWNCGYDEKYLNDQGALYKAISKKWWRLLCLQDALRRYKSYNTSPFKAYKIMVKGAKNFR
ncbi:MAG: glycosyltransferase [Clostridia bacterium]|nr:glycosyltransferase [Clostridia bacterium]